MILKEFLDMFTGEFLNLNIIIHIETVKFVHNTFRSTLEKNEDKRWLLLTHVVKASIKDNCTLCVLVNFENTKDEKMETETPWYTENWYDADLEQILINNDMEPTRENVEKLKSQCLHLFDDKSTRNEILEDVARSLKENMK